MSRVEYHIFKRTKGVPFPGEFWEECGSLAKARRVFKRNYANHPDMAQDEKDAFHIIRTTYTRVR
jgi:hypothetical protein